MGEKAGDACCCELCGPEWRVVSVGGGGAALGGRGGEGGAGGTSALCDK